MTGLTLINVELAAKRLALLHELVPNASVVALLENPSNPNRESKEMEDAARSLRLHLNVLNASTEADIDAAFVTLLQQRINGLLIASDVFLSSRRDHIAALAARHKTPVISPFRGYAAAGGLMKLPRMIPQKIAMELALTGDFIDTARAYELGLLNRVTDGSALDAAIELAGKITANGPIAVRVSKQIVVESGGWSQDEMWDKQSALLPQVFMSEDAREGAAAFAEKRAPNWKGK